MVEPYLQLTWKQWPSGTANTGQMGADASAQESRLCFFAHLVRPYTFWRAETQRELGTVGLLWGEEPLLRGIRAQPQLKIPRFNKNQLLATGSNCQHVLKGVSCSNQSALSLIPSRVQLWLLWVLSWAGCPAHGKAQRWGVTLVSTLVGCSIQAPQSVNYYVWKALACVLSCCQLL